MVVPMAATVWTIKQANMTVIDRHPHNCTNDAM